MALNITPEALFLHLLQKYTLEDRWPASTSHSYVYIVIYTFVKTGYKNQNIYKVRVSHAYNYHFYGSNMLCRDT